MVALSALIVVLIALLISFITGIYLFVIFTIGIVLSLAAPFFDVPSLKKSGGLVYYSSLFLAERPKNGVIKIHGGSLFDYVFVIDSKMNGKQRTNFILQQYMEGLLNLIETNESNGSEDLKISGTSYIINDRTAQRIGFTVVQTDFLQKLILIYNYFNVSISYSIARGKLSFPKLSETKTFEASIKELAKQKNLIKSLNQKLKRNTAHVTQVDH